MTQPMDIPAAHEAQSQATVAQQPQSNKQQQPTRQTVQEGEENGKGREVGKGKREKKGVGKETKKEEREGQQARRERGDREGSEGGRVERKDEKDEEVGKVVMCAPGGDGRAPKIFVKMDGMKAVLMEMSQKDKVLGNKWA